MAERAAEHCLECYRWEKQLPAIHAALLNSPPLEDAAARL
jgi:hypothetical protein